MQVCDTATGYCPEFEDIMEIRVYITTNPKTPNFRRVDGMNCPNQNKCKHANHGTCPVYLEYRSNN